MPYIGQQPTNVAFLTDQFSGNGSTTAFTLSAAPANTSSILVAISGVLQDPSTYSVSGTTLTFSPAPPTGTGNISVRFLGIPASGVTTTAYRTVTEFTATSGQTTFSVPSYTVGFIDVYRNGVLLGSADYTATSGVSVVLVNGCTVGDLVEVISFQVSSVLNAIPNSPASVGTSNIANGVTINFADGSASTPSITNDGDNNTGMFFPAADTIAFAEGGVEVARFNSSGDLGLGTSSPTAKLSINTATATDYISFLTAGSTRGVIGDESGNFIVKSAAALLMQTNGAERMRIASDGNVLIGTTSSTGAKFDVTQSINTAAASAFFDSRQATTSNQYGIVQRLLNDPNNTAQYIFHGLGGATERCTIRSNGGIANFSGNNVNLSDAREKTNVELAGSYLDKVCAIPVKTFNYIDQNRDEDDGLTLGVIAQDVEAVAPELVMESNWGTQEEPKMRLSIYQTDLQYALMKCIQEQQAIITDLKARVEALENK